MKITEDKNIDNFPLFLLEHDILMFSATRSWWDNRRSQFALYISQVVLDEVARGDAQMAARRLELLRDLPLLEVDLAVQNLAAQLLSQSNLPPKASDDALHIAVATVYGLDYLLTWNCKHIANAQIQKKLALA